MSNLSRPEIRNLIYIYICVKTFDYIYVIAVEFVENVCYNII